jgi:hypothetical protein
MTRVYRRMSIGLWAALSLALAARAQSPASTPATTPAAPVMPAKPAGTAQSEAGDPRVNTSRAAPPKGKNVADRVDLDTTTITGNRELPKVLYIVPWKRSDIGDLIGRPVNSLLDEILAPVDRDVFRREVVYYQALKPDAAQKPAPPAEGEK